MRTAQESPQCKGFYLSACGNLGVVDVSLVDIIFLVIGPISLNHGYLHYLEIWEILLLVKIYATNHYAAKETIQRSFGLLKGRSFSSTASWNKHVRLTVNKLITACFVPHNICIALVDHYPADNVWDIQA